MATTKSTGQKHELDKLYTTDKVANWCLDQLSSIRDLSDYTLVVEPSAGGGAFLRAVEQHGLTAPVKAYDLVPEAEDIEAADWFEVALDAPSPVLVLGNPPYGQQNSLAVRFINHAAAQPCVDTIAFVLPKSFKKEAVQSRLDPNFVLAGNFDLLDTTFLLEGEPYKVPTTFQVWTRSNTPRRTAARKNAVSALFSVVKSPQDADLRIQRVGGRAGKASTDLNRSSASNYWIKLDKAITPAETNEFVAFVNGLTFPTINDTVGPRSLPLSELVEVVEANWPKPFTKPTNKPSIAEMEGLF